MIDIVDLEAGAERSRVGSAEAHAAVEVARRGGWGWADNDKPSPVRPSTVNIASGRSWCELGWARLITITISPAQPSPLPSISPPAVLGLGWA